MVQAIQEVYEPVPCGMNVRPTLDHKCECGRRDAIVLPTAPGKITWSCLQCKRVITGTFNPGSVTFHIERAG